AEDGIRDKLVTGVQTCALPIWIVCVQKADELQDALGTAFAHDELAIAEAAATGLEVECSVLGNADPIASQPGEIMLAAGESSWRSEERRVGKEGRAGGAAER